MDVLALTNLQKKVIVMAGWHLQNINTAQVISKGGNHCEEEQKARVERQCKHTCSTSGKSHGGTGCGAVRGNDTSVWRP